jgi:hypothetical protein
MPDPQPNLPLLRKVLDQIDNDPAHWDQNWWEAGPSSRKRKIWTEIKDKLGRLFRRQVNYDTAYGKCGTTRCIGGWVQFWAEGKVDPDETYAVAMHELGLTPEEAYALFYHTANGSPEEQRRKVEKVAKRIAQRGGERL